MRHALPFLLALLTGGGMLGCSAGDDSGMETFAESGFSFQHPKGWHVTGFSTTNSPHRLAVTSYRVPADAVEGDCGGLAAVERLPTDGVLVIVIDYGEQASFPPRPSPLTIADGELAEYECFGRSSMFRFRVGRRDVQAHLAFGDETGDDAHQQALSILTSIELTERP
jgi:hypothetical protein